MPPADNVPCYSTIYVELNNQLTGIKMATIRTYLGLPSWADERYPEHWPLFTKAASSGISEFETLAEETIVAAGNPDEVDDHVPGEIARDVFSRTFSVLNSVALSDDEWDDLESSFEHQMKNHFDTSLSISWKPKAKP